ncbi:polysaccharide deacetylase family protein [Niveibacterium sp. SC-1]|uniref:polysaccharide deacetylase family protein n=1 Tax=Niveibacterium sp. SC-1 TaxID=3135646 RepID=UPI00311FE2C7
MRSTLAIALLACLNLWSGLCHAAPAPGEAPIRFLLSFDDGPVPAPGVHTRMIQRSLQDNPVMPGIKAVFFMQTEHPVRGGSEAGSAMMRETCEAGHVLAVHSGHVRGHVSHTRMTEDELVRTLDRAKAHIAETCERTATLVRPPNWSYTPHTLDVYGREGLQMVLTDLSANDGKIYGWIVSLRRRIHLHHELELVAEQRAAGKMPVVDGVIPVVATFHDTNLYTAEHAGEYLQILVEEAREIGLPLADKPFYDNAAELTRAASARAELGKWVCDGASRTVSLRERLFGDGSVDSRRDCF